MRLVVSLRAVALVIAILFVPAANAADIHVMISGGVSAAYKALTPEFEKATGHKLITVYGPSMGHTQNAIPARLDRGEPRRRADHGRLRAGRPR